MKKIISLIAVIALIATYALFAMASGESSSSGSSGSVASSTPDVTTTDNTEKTEAPDSSSETSNTNDQLRINVGEKLTTKDLEINFVSCGEYNEDNQFMQPDAGYKYVFMYVECTNTGTSDKTISEFSFDCYADNNACDGYYGGDNQLSATLSAGRSANGYVYFTVPTNAQSIEVEYEINIWTGEKAIFLIK